jgi:hypothetical protein
MPSARRLAVCSAGLLAAAVACAPQPDALRPAVVTTSTASSQIVGTRYEAVVDPVAHTVMVSPVGMHTQTAGVWVRSANAVWSAPVFSFDLLVTNNSGTSLSTVRGIVLSTTPGSPTVQPTGTNGTLGSGQPYYDYGIIANGATGSANWKFSIPSVTPFRFGFTIQQGAGVDAGPQKNQAPVAISLTPANPNLVAGGSTTVTATASDPNADSLTYSWSAPAGGTISGSGATITYTAPGTPGTYPVDVTVDDGKGGTATSTTTLSVGAGGGNGTAQGNVSFGPMPGAVVQRVTLSPAAVTIDPGDPLLITATGLDNPGNPVATDWTWSQVGTNNSIWRGTFDTGTSGNVAPWRTFDGRTDAGTVTVTARSANNQKGSMTITIREKPPVPTSINPPTTFHVPAGTAPILSVVFHDPNGNNMGVPSFGGSTSGPAFSIVGVSYPMLPPVAPGKPAYPDLDGNVPVTIYLSPLLGPATYNLSATLGDTVGGSGTVNWQIVVP